jgi:hypothetical protein
LIKRKNYITDSDECGSSIGNGQSHPSSEASKKTLAQAVSLARRRQLRRFKGSCGSFGNRGPVSQSPQDLKRLAFNPSVDDIGWQSMSLVLNGPMLRHSTERRLAPVVLEIALLEMARKNGTEFSEECPYLPPVESPTRDGLQPSSPITTE